MLVLSVLALLGWLAVLLLPWQPWRNTDVLLLAGPDGPEDDDLADTTVVIPARNEAPVIPATLAALAEQGCGLRVLLVDDNSTDGTAEAARAIPGLDLEVISGRPLPEGWAGKVWALHQGVEQVRTPLILLLDADIALAAGVIRALRAQLRRGGYGLASVMASLHMVSFWEKLLAPSFIYFFKLLYPFRLAQGRQARFYAAAGGCMLLQTRALAAAGGLAAIRGELIDDCALAREIKQAGYRLWIGQSRAVRCIRAYRDLAEIWHMVARSAFTQLRYSLLILLLVTACIGLLFVWPLGGLFTLAAAAGWLSLLA